MEKKTELTQLNDLINYVELLSGKKLTDEQKDYFKSTLSLTFNYGYHYGHEVGVKSLKK